MNYSNWNQDNILENINNQFLKLINYNYNTNYRKLLNILITCT